MALLTISAAAVGCNEKPATISTSTSAATTHVASISTSTTSTHSDKGTPPTASRTAAVKTTADALTKEVIADENGAKAKYNGKIVEIEGQVSTANKVINGDGFFLKGARKEPTDSLGVLVICNVPSEARGRAWRLGVGQKVKVVGTATISVHLYLADCTFEALEPPKTPRVTAKQLVEEMLKDADAAVARYQTPDGRDGDIIVDGIVAELERTKDGERFVKLAGAGDVTVSCFVQESDFKSVKVGDQITIKGDFSGYYPNKKKVNVNTAFILSSD